MSTVLVVGSGGREHALAWKLSRSPRVDRVIVAPGNDGFPSDWERWHLNAAEGKPAFQRLAQRALDSNVNLAVIGPDNPLADGIVDVFEAYGIRVFGPSAAAARIESSKAFSKDVMRAAGVPTARYEVVNSLEMAEQFLKSAGWPPETGNGWVIKADGLALGKGVKVCTRLDEALQAARELIAVSGKLVIEERLIGEEISWMAFCDGEGCAMLEPARDHKRLLDGDQGPNTGGMGAFSPVPGLPEGLAEQVREQVFLPTLQEMRKRGSFFKGLLYAGLMLEPKTGKFWVLEFNARFGDPEAQVLLPRMDDDLYPWLKAVAKGDLGGMPQYVPFVKEAAVFVVGAARGYPENPEKGRPIVGLQSSLMNAAESGAEPYFLAGVKREEGGSGLVTNGGRVLGALGMGATLQAAREQAYQRLKKISFEGMQFRTDIAGGLG